MLIHKGEKMKILFTDTIGVEEEYRPIPASKQIPDWYKDTESYVNKEKKPMGNGRTSGTIKRCLPVFDAINSGYIITTYTDVYVSQSKVLDENNNPTNLTIPYWEWPSLEPIKWHPVAQAQNHPGKKDLSDTASYPKWMNPWAIKTPPGYSCLFIPPLHRESVFTILEGVVDTDKYYAPVNFPFVLNDWKFEGLIPAGTPIAQVIPFKRESWKLEIGNQEDLIKQSMITKKLHTKIFDSYKLHFRQIKEYK
jgi:hypothetical protein